MSQKDSLIIKQDGEIISHTTSQSEMIVFDEEKRLKFIQILRQTPAYLEVVKKLSEGKTYKAIVTPEVLARIKDGSAILDKKDNGLLGTTIRDAKTGEFVGRVSLKEVTPDLLSSLNQLATQQALADIVYRLGVIDEKIADVLEGQFNDRLAEVKNGIGLYKQALGVSDPDFRRELMGNAIGELNRGRTKLIESTDLSFIDTMPRNRLMMLFRGKRDIPEYVQSKAELVVKATHAIIEATHFLAMAYSDLNEPDALRVSFEQVENEIKVFQDKTGEIVRWLSPVSNLHESLTTISQGVLPSIHDLDEISQKTIVVEFQPKEILAPKGA